MKNLKKITFLLLTAIAFISCSVDDNNSSACETCTYSPANGETTTTVPTVLQKDYNVIVDTSVNGYRFAKGTIASFKVEATKLTVNFDNEPCFTMENPVASANGGEIIFTDNCNENITYRISGGSSLNEINIISISGTFLASIKAQ